MKKFYTLLLALITTVSFGQPVITGIVDGTCSGGTPKMIEIFAQGTVDFSQYKLEKQSNGNGFSGNLDLSSLGTVTNDYVYLYNDGSNSGAFASNFPATSGKPQLADSYISGNGDDAFRIVDNSNNVIDVFGVENEDGSGKVWEYKDSYAKRNTGAPASATFDASQWTFGGPDFLDGQCGSLETAMGGIQTYYVAPASGDFLNEDFESGTFPPAGWTNFQAGDPAGWQESTSRANSPTHSAFHDDDNVSTSCNDWLITPALDLSTSNRPELSYFENINYGSWADQHNVLISTDYIDGNDPSTATWTVLNDVIGTEDTWEEKTFDLSAYKVANVHIAFQYVGDYASEWYIDDVVVAEAPACPNPSNLQAENITDTTADITWEGNGANDWKITWGATGFTPDFSASANVIDVNGNPQYQLTGLTEASDYDVYIMADCGNGLVSQVVGPLSFSTTIQNSICSGALPLYVYNIGQSSGHETAGSTANYVTDSGMHTSCDDIGENLDLFYTFILPQGHTGIKVITSGDKGDKIEAAIYDSCGGTELACEGRSSEKAFTNLTGGQQYFLQVWHDSFEKGDFNIVLEYIPEPGNNDCDTAQNLPVYPVGGSAGNETSGNTQYASTSGLQAGCAANAEKDLFYQFTLPADQTDVTIFVGGDAGNDLKLAVYDSCGGNEVACLEDENRYFLRGLTAGSTYIIQAWHDAGDEGLFNIAVEIAPPLPVNDECMNAIDIPVDTTSGQCSSYVTGNNEYATDSGIGIPSCSNSNGYGSGGDVWFTVTVPDSGEVTISTSAAPGSDINDTVMAAYSGDCTNLTEMDCDDDGGSGLFSKIELTGLNPGDVIYVRVYEYGNNSFGNFYICAYDPTVQALADNHIEGLKYYPNPANDILNISTPDNIQHISLFDIAGKEVMSLSPDTNETQLNIGHLNKGIYFVKILVNDQLTTFKIVKE